MAHTELGTFSFTYRALGVHGVGISASSNFAVLYEACQLFLRHGPPISNEVVAKAALRFERHMAHANAIADDDVYPITYGGLVRITTKPNTLVDGAEIDGEVVVEPVSYDSRWLAEHVVVAFDPLGERHEIPHLHAKLFRHPAGVSFVEQLSDLADIACTAIAGKDLNKLATTVQSYVSVLNQWTGDEYTANVRSVAEKLVCKLPSNVLAWKPPGGGASKSLIVIVADRHARDAVLGFFEDENWWATPALVTGGIYCEYVKTKGDVRFTAGHRLDFVGGADLGQDIAIRKEGRCCSCAIEPRAEILLSLADFRQP